MQILAGISKISQNLTLLILLTGQSSHPSAYLNVRLKEMLTCATSTDFNCEAIYHYGAKQIKGIDLNAHGVKILGTALPLGWLGWGVTFPTSWGAAVGASVIREP